MLELDDGEDFVGELIDEALNETLDIIYKKYIDKQLLPYTVSQAKEAILTIIDVSQISIIYLFNSNLFNEGLGDSVMAPWLW